MNCVSSFSFKKLCKIGVPSRPNTYPIDKGSIPLNIVNKSMYIVNIVVFQKNIVDPFSTEVFAWQVVRLGRGGSKVIYYSPFLKISPTYIITPGFKYSITPTGTILSGSSGSSTEIDIENISGFSVINKIYRSQKLLDADTILNGQIESYQFFPAFFIGHISNVSEGDALTPSEVASVNTQISLLGIKSTDIAITGSPGTFSFTLENVVF